MSFRKIFSGLKKKSKHRLARGRHEPEGIGADTGGESVDSMGSLPQPEHRVIGKSEHDRPQSGNEADVDGGRVDSRAVPTSGGQHDKGGREAAIEGKETGGLYLDLDAKHVAESGPSEGGNGVGRDDQVDPLPSAPSMEPESM